MKIIGNLIGYFIVLLAIAYVLAIPALLIANIWTGDVRYGRTGGVMAAILVLACMAGWYVHDRVKSKKDRRSNINFN